jgi:general secretion pathway protein A
MAIYDEFFGFRTAPFALSPDPRFLFLSRRHREALAGLLYAVEDGKGFTVLTGEVGTGKTTLVHALLNELGDKARTAFVFNPTLNRNDLYLHLLAEFHLPARDSILACSRTLQAFLLEQFQTKVRVVVVLDEAHSLSDEILEEVRLLSNFETSQSKLLHVLLIGQPELRTRLEQHSLRQLRQRIALRFELPPFDFDETIEYVHWRLRRAGARTPIFASAAYPPLYRYSGGMPRLINILSDNALLTGFARDVRTVGPDLIRLAARDLALPALGSVSIWQRLFGQHRRQVNGSAPPRSDSPFRTQGGGR